MSQIQRKKPAGAKDYLDIALRRIWWIVIPTILVTCIVTGVSLRMPKRYRSETLILVDPQKVPSDLVKSTVSGDVTDRLQSIGQEILSRTRLERIIEKFNLYSDHRKGHTQEEIVEMMRNDIAISVNIDTEHGSGKGGTFRITYQGSDPALVQQVTRQIASLYIDENLKVREQQAEGTADFIDSQLDKARKDLDEQDAKLKQFRSRFTGSLPEQQQTNLSLLGQYQSLLQANNDALQRAQEQETYLQSMIAAAPKAMEKTVRTPSPLETQLNAKRAELIQAQQRYSPSHPDVKRLESEVAALQQKVKETEKSEIVSNDTPDMTATQLKSQLEAIESEIKLRNVRQQETEKKIRELESKVEMLPAVQEQFSQLTRDYDATKANYEALQQKKSQSDIAADMERHAKGEQFVILDPASYPEKPFSPNMPMLNLGGLGAGLALGCALAFLMELRDKSIHTATDMAYYTNIPVLGELPVIETAASLKLAKKRLRLYWAGAFAFIITMSAVVAFLYSRGFMHGLVWWS